MLSVLLLAGACSRLDEQATALSIYVRLPEQETTKADADDGALDWASLLAKETRINDLRIWVFANDVTGKEKGALLGYLEPKQLNMSNGKVQKFTVALDRDLASNIKTVDVYVLANSAAIVPPDEEESAVQLDAQVKPAELDALMLSGALFGLDAGGAPTNTTVVDNAGLPYSAVRKNVSLTKTGTDLSVANLELVRAVSKVQFVFCQIMLEDEQGNKETPVNFEIKSLELNGGQIPQEEYLFNDSGNAWKIVDNKYVASALKVSGLPAKKDVAGSTGPGAYAHNGTETFLEYQNRINRALQAGAVTGMAPCYLRESDKTLSGTITYAVDGETREPVKFSMVDGERFARNSSWIVYFYFNNNTMSLSVAYSSWDAGDGPYTIIGY